MAGFLIGASGGGLGDEASSVNYCTLHRQSNCVCLQYNDQYHRYLAQIGQVQAQSMTALTRIDHTVTLATPENAPSISAHHVTSDQKLKWNKKLLLLGV